MNEIEKKINNVINSKILIALKVDLQFLWNLKFVFIEHKLSNIKENNKFKEILFINGWFYNAFRLFTDTHLLVLKSSYVYALF